MKTCPVCALDLEDSYLFCPDDGSSLAGSFGDSRPGPFVRDNPSDYTANVVLYCPACGAEYPLTFSSCPVHGVPLTKQSIQTSVKEPEDFAVQANAETIVLNRPPFIALHKNIEGDNIQADNMRGDNLDAEPVAIGSITSTDTDIIETRQSYVEASTSASPRPGIPAPSFSSQARGADQPGFRIAAIATMIALAIFGLVGLYAFVSNLSRRPSAVTRSASQSEPAQEVPFVVTPETALDSKEDHKEGQPATPASEKSADTPSPTRVVERERKETVSSSSEERNRTASDVQSLPRMASQATRVSTPATDASDTAAPVLPHTNSRGFDSRLVRARSSKTSTGYRYDLTFNMQEQLGHSAQWQRVLITTRSASGASHTQAIPFVHRLGATGALTFTISVELTGRSEADWRGRINCTTLGWDNVGAPLQTTFAANVTP